MGRFRAILFILALVVPVPACTRSQIPDDRAIVDRFMGKWYCEQEGERYTLELKENVALTGIFQSELLSRDEFSVEEVDRAGQSIVIHGFSEDLSEDASDTKTEHHSKLVLQDNGKTLQYIYDYQGRKIESLWHR